jgi:hypothetical protein
MVIAVGRLVQFPVTAALVQLMALPPAEPDTGSVPVHEVPVVDVAFHVNVPEKALLVAVPETVPFVSDVDQVPETALPACVSVIVSASLYAPPLASVACQVPDQFPARPAGADRVGAARLLPHATVATRSTKTHTRLTIWERPWNGWAEVTSSVRLPSAAAAGIDDADADSVRGRAAAGSEGRAAAARRGASASAKTPGHR